MREKYLWLVIGILAVLTLGYACYTYEPEAVAKEISAPPQESAMQRKAHSEKAFDSQWEELEKWRRKVRERIYQGFPLTEPDFDGFFNDRFFAGRLEPFAEIERVRKEMSEEFRDSEKTLFEDYWKKWSGQRLLTGQFKTETAGTDKDITLTMHVPGLSAMTTDVDINSGRIRIAFTANTSSEENTPRGIIKRSGPRNYIKILPVPEDAEPGTGKAVIDGERVTISFRRKSR